MPIISVKIKTIYIENKGVFTVGSLTKGEIKVLIPPQRLFLCVLSGGGEV